MIGSSCAAAASRIRPSDAIDPGGDERLLDQGVGRDHVDRLLSAVSSGRSRIAIQISCRTARGILAAAVADDPGDGVAQVELADLVREPLDGFREPPARRTRSAEFGRDSSLRWPLRVPL